jgi:succinylarginine dihydrolase
MAREVNFDGLVGPTHNYGGLSLGNLASQNNAASVSRPREAALQGLAKAKALAAMGLVQGVLPPHERPFLPVLRARALAGDDGDVLRAAWRADPRLLTNACSSAHMWAANAATVSPAADTGDGRVHFTPGQSRHHGPPRD